MTNNLTDAQTQKCLKEDLGGQTLFDKIWDAHVVSEVANGPTQLYIDRHFCHEVTSPQAFNGLRARGLKVFGRN